MTLHAGAVGRAVRLLEVYAYNHPKVQDLLPATSTVLAAHMQGFEPASHRKSLHAFQCVLRGLGVSPSTHSTPTWLVQWGARE